MEISEEWNTAHTSKFYIASEGSALNQVEKNLCWHATALYYKTYTFIVQKFCSHLLYREFYKRGLLILC